jgi:UDP-glucuronate 4-epimerase
MTYTLVTGSAGFIGSHVSEALLAQGEMVIGLDNLNDYYSPAWKKNNLKEALKSPNYTFIEADILNIDELKVLFNKYPITKIIHLAARAGVRPSIEQPILYEKVNVQGTLNLLELAREYAVANFIFASSSSVYGNQKKVPFSEKDRVDEPISPYAATKKAGELHCYTYHHLYKVPITCLRFFTVYGERGRPDMAPYLFSQAILQGQPINKYGNGETSRDYTYIKDIVTGILSAYSKPKPYRILNLGNEKPVSLNNFIATIEKITGKKAKIILTPSQPGDVDQTWADINQAKKELNYLPNYPLEEGLKRMILWLSRERLKL